jgi:hypothetical protein
MRPDYNTASNCSGLLFPKGTTRRDEKASKDYRDKREQRRVKGIVKRRDGHCRLGKAAPVVGDCMGASTWQHYTRRSETRGMAPQERHNTATSGMNCMRHHRMIDEYEITVEYLTDKGADGRANLTGANLGGANLRVANLGGANLTGANLPAPTCAAPTWAAPTCAAPT